MDDPEPGVEPYADHRRTGFYFGQPIGEVQQSVQGPLGLPVAAGRTEMGTPAIEAQPVGRHPTSGHVSPDEPYGGGRIVRPGSEVGGCRGRLKESAFVE